MCRNVFRFHSLGSRLFCSCPGALGQHFQRVHRGWSQRPTPHGTRFTHTWTRLRFPGSELHLWAFVGSARLWPSGPAALWPSHLPGHPLPATASQARVSFPITTARCPVQQTPSAVALGKPNVAFPSGQVDKGTLQQWAIRSDAHRPSCASSCVQSPESWPSVLSCPVLCSAGGGPQGSPAPPCYQT